MKTTRWHGYIKILIAILFFIITIVAVRGGSTANTTIGIPAINVTIFTDRTLWFENLTATTYFECLNCNYTNYLHFPRLLLANWPQNSVYDAADGIYDQTKYTNKSSCSSGCAITETASIIQQSMRNTQNLGVSINKTTTGTWNTQTTSNITIRAAINCSLYSGSAETITTALYLTNLSTPYKRNQVINTITCTDATSKKKNTITDYIIKLNNTGNSKIWNGTTWLTKDLRNTQITIAGLITKTSGGTGDAHGYIKITNITSYGVTTGYNARNFNASLSQFPTVSLNPLNYQQFLTSCSVALNFTLAAVYSVPVQQCSDVTKAVFTTALTSTTTERHNNSFRCINDSVLQLNTSLIECPGTNILEFFKEGSMLNFSVFDESEPGHSYINATVTLLLINANVSNQHTFSGGKLFLNSTPIGDYEVRYSAPGYVSRTYWFTVGIQNKTKIHLFLINSSDATNILAVVQDEGNAFVSEAYVKALRYSVSLNSYELVEMAKTDNEGKALLHLEMNSEWYKFLIEKNSRTYFQSSPKQILSTTIYFSISLLENVWESFFQTMNLYHTLTYNNNTRTFVFTWSDTQNYLREGCLKVTRRTFKTEQEMQNTCLQSIAGSLSYTVNPNITGTYMAYAYIDSLSNHSLHPLQTLIEVFGDSPEKVFGKTGLLLGFLVIGTLVLIGAWSPVVSLIMLLIALIVGVISGIWIIGVVGITSLGALIILLIWRMKN